MDLFSSLIPYLKGLIASSLIALHLMLGSGYNLFSAFGATESPLAQISVTTSTPKAATSTKAAVVATTTPKIPTKTIAKATPVSPVQATTPKTNLTPLLSSDSVNTNTRASIVNILCSTASSNGGRSISGSGVIVDARGVVLTNAHIGQYFLLMNALGRDKVDCVIRAGSPAAPLYRATLLYLPPQWVDANATQISAEHALGTGEYDYAFLLINGRTDPQASLPSSFTNIAMSGTSLDTGENVLVAGYPAGFLDSETIQRNLYATSAFTAIGQLYTFNSASNVDVVSLGGTIVSQGGSSGGAVVRLYDGKLAGLIATASTGTTTASRDLHAITINYIDRSLSEAGKAGIVGLLSGNIVDSAAQFNADVAPKEAQKIIDALK
jgi:hypothetical protein